MADIVGKHGRAKSRRQRYVARAGARLLLRALGTALGVRAGMGADSQQNAYQGQTLRNDSRRSSGAELVNHHDTTLVHGLKEY
jgi:hypothetical protein